jgi:ankyrin repeat protein
MKYTKIILILLITYILYKKYNKNYRLENYETTYEKIKKKYYSNYWNRPIVLINVMKKNDLEALNKLLIQGFNVNYKDEKGRTAIFYCKDKKTFNLLTSYGAKINLKDDTGRTLLQHYINLYNSQGFKDFKNDFKTGIKDIIELLLSYGVDVNMTDENDETALSLILKSSYCDHALDVFKILIKYGADCKSKTISNRTTIMTAAQNKNCNTLEFIKYLISNGADLFAIDKKGNNALFYATETENIDLIKYLLSKGLDPNLVNKDGKNVINNTIKNGTRNINKNSEVVHLLVSHGANYDHIDYRLF